MCFLKKKLEPLSASSHTEILHMIWKRPFSAEYLCFKEADSGQDKSILECDGQIISQ